MTFPFLVRPPFLTESSVTFNPSDKAANITLSNGNFDAVTTAASAWANVRATVGRASGQYYFEFVSVADSAAGGNHLAGMLTSGASLTASIGSSANGFGHIFSGANFATGSTVANNVTTTLALNDVMNLAVDLDAGKAWYGKNGTWQTGNPIGATSPWITGLSGSYFPAGGLFTTSNTIRLRTALSQFTGTVPAGYKPWDAN